MRIHSGPSCPRLAAFAAAVLLTFAAVATPVAAAVEARHVEVGAGFYVVDGVNIRNGNFAISYHQLGAATDDGPAIPLVITYNSRSSTDGYFGVGWGSPLESRLAVMPDGSVIVQEIGTGNLTVYGEPGDDEVASGVERIVAAVAGADKLDADAQQRLRTDLLHSREHRFAKVVAYHVVSTLPERQEVPVDMSTTFVGQSCGHAWVEWDKEMFWRGCDDVIESFTPDGRIAMKYDGESEEYLNFTYRDGVLRRIDSGSGRSLELTWDGGHVAQLKSDTGATMAFRYDARGNQIRQAESGGLAYGFDYDAKANMTVIHYIDDSVQTMRYDGDNRAVSVARRGGAGSVFEYQNDLADPTRWLTKATHHAEDGSVDSIAVFEMHD